MNDNIDILCIDQEKKFSFISNAHLLIDTNFLIDAIHYQNIFKELISTIKNTGCTFVSLDAVLYEFTKGSKSLPDYKKRLEFYNNIVDANLPIENHIQEQVIILVKLLLKRSSHLSYTDCLLLSTLVRYKSNIYLLSKDRSDISTSIFPVVYNIHLETSENNMLYSVYSFDKDAYVKRLKEITKNL